MPQIDFGEFFATPAKVVSRVRPLDSAAPSVVSAKKSGRRMWLKFVAGLLVGLPIWANMILITGAFISGLFCAYQLFDRSEILHTAVMWPREFLYQRPLYLTQPTTDILQRIGESRRGFLANSSTSAFDRGANRFGKGSGLPVSSPGLAEGPLNHPTSLPAFPAGASSLPGEVSDPGRAALSNAGSQAASSAASAKKTNAQRIVRVITTPAKCRPARANVRSGKAAQSAGKAMAKSTAPQQIAQQTSRLTEATRNQATRDLRSTNSRQQNGSAIRAVASRSMPATSSVRTGGNFSGRRR